MADINEIVRQANKTAEIVREATKTADLVREANRTADILRGSITSAYGVTRVPPLPPVPRNMMLEEAKGHYASQWHKRLISMIADFETGLDDAHEVGARLVSFGQSVTFHIDDVGYWDPATIIFHGRLEDGQPVQLIQHVTQISVLLMALPRLDPSKPRVGFRLMQEEKETSSTEE